MKKLCLFIFLLISIQLHAQDDFIGTHANPIALIGKNNSILSSVSLYFYTDNSYEIHDNGQIIFTGQFTNNQNTVEFSNRPAFANKAFITNNGKTITCLQTVFYRPQKYHFQTDFFCKR